MIALIAGAGMRGSNFITVVMAVLTLVAETWCGCALKAAERDRNDWWSLKKPQRPAVPTPGEADRAWVRTPVDAFVLAKLREKGLSPTAEADRRTLLRRLHFDLTGLPPRPEDVDAFRDDPDPLAYEKLVERLLASPAYGERWGRHWLDVVHYGDTHGYDKDKPRASAWPYRDYVIRAFNDDKPYTRFVAEQLAGDVFYPGTVDGIEALGFIAAGPWDFIGHAEVPESKIDGKIARHLDRDDMVSNTMNTFQSLTVHCAQCHNHKFDPITQEDYFSLHAVFAAVDRTEKQYYADPATARIAAELEARKQSLKKKRQELEAEIARSGGEPLAELDRKIAALQKPKTGEQPEFGYHSQIETTQDRVKWVQIDLGKAMKIDRIEWVGCHDTFNNIGAGFGFPVRFKIEIGDDAEMKTAEVVRETKEDFPNQGVVPQSTTVTGKSARYVRVTALKLAPRMNDYIFALAELSVYDADGKNLALGAGVTALDSIEAPPRWQKKNLVDGYYYGRKGGPAQAELTELQAKRTALIERVVDAKVRKTLDEILRESAQVDADSARLPAPRTVYIGSVHTGSGTFVGTGAGGGKPRPIHILPRGDVTNPGKEAVPGAVHALAELPGRFELPTNHTEGDRRAALAKWITADDNPLTWRSIVNRVWRYHIGRGIVESPNDFGRMGQLPTHPELLDWLAVEFRESGQSLKQLHRLIVTSSVYRQASSHNEAFAGVDADNAYLWRMNRRRLEAEALRDAVLEVSGKLQRRMTGPGFQDFVIEKPEHSPHYQYHLHDAEDPRSHRRSVYRFLVRSQQQPFMTALDCADPSMQVDRRNETLSPLQALALLNNNLILAMSKHFATRLTASETDIAQQVTHAVRLAIQRNPTEEELRQLTDYTRKHGPANLCRVLLNLNEFVFVD